MKLLKNVWQMVRRDRLFSGIYIFGTALALATCTVFAVLMYLKVAPVYPEYKRGRMAYASSVNMASKKSDSRYISTLSYPLVRELFMKMENVECVSAQIDDWLEHYVQTPASGDIEVRVKQTDCNFFRLYDFDFLAGAPFSEADFESGLRKAVISEKLARHVFGPVEPRELIGKYLSLDFAEYQICGVVKQGTPTEQWSYAQVYSPYTIRENWNIDDPDMRPWMGDYKVAMLCDDIEGAARHVKEFAERYNNSQDEYELYLYNQPIDQYQEGLSSVQDDNFDVWSQLYAGLGLVLVLMLVPALNLSGIISGRMEGRLAEMGVRKSFGATRGQLLRQVLCENFVLTLAGAVIGFAMAYLIIKSPLMDYFATGDSPMSEITNEMVFAPAIFVFLLVLTFVLNLLSALVPSWRSLRRPIVESLKEK